MCWSCAGAHQWRRRQYRLCSESSGVHPLCAPSGPGCSEKCREEALRGQGGAARTSTPKSLRRHCSSFGSSSPSPFVSSAWNTLLASLADIGLAVQPPPGAGAAAKRAHAASAAGGWDRAKRWAFSAKGSLVRCVHVERTDGCGNKRAAFDSRSQRLKAGAVWPAARQVARQLSSTANGSTVERTAAFWWS